MAPASAGRRLDVVLAEAFSLSRAQVRRLLARGAVRLDGRPVGEGAKGERVRESAEIEVAAFVPRAQQQARAEPGAPVALLARGPGWLAVDKRAGVPVHPLEEGEPGTLLGALLARQPELQGVGEGGLRSGVVHRLDVDTSGVMLFATSQPSWERLRAAFREHRVEKVYRALVRGQLSAGEARLALAVARHRPARVRVVEGPELARARGVWWAETSWRPLARFAAATLLEVRPRTGFLHQIRASLAHLGHPVLGDAIYDPEASPGDAPRQLLHAERIAFEEIEAESPIPPDFSAACDLWRTQRAAAE